MITISGAGSSALRSVYSALQQTSRWLQNAVSLGELNFKHASPWGHEVTLWPQWRFALVTPRRNSNARNPRVSERWDGLQVSLWDHSAQKLCDRSRTLELFAVRWGVKPLATTMFTARPTGRFHLIPIRAAARSKCDLHHRAKLSASNETHSHQHHQNWTHSEPVLWMDGNISDSWNKKRK